MDERPDLWVGLRLERVATAWFEHSNHRSDEPVHLWVEFSGDGWRQLRGAAAGHDVLVLSGDPHESYEMPEFKPELSSKLVDPHRS